MSSRIVDKINSCLQSEIAAVQIYDQALQKINDPNALSDLRSAQNSHAARAEKLKKTVRKMGAEPELGSGLKGAMARAAEGTANIFGEKAAVSILEEGEDNTLHEYEKLMNEPEEELQSIAKDMLDEQREIHDMISRLKHSL